MDRCASLLTPLLPAWAVATALHPRWRVHWPGRWGISVPPVQPGAIWVHAASVGEIGAAWALVAQLPDPVLLTADTDTGVARAHELARGRPGVAVGIRPVDHPWTLAPLWAEARPRLLVFVEGTFWPVLAGRARRAGIPVLRVSARLGRRTAKLAPLLRAWWSPVTHVYARDRAAAEALAPFHRCPVEVGGDLKRAASTDRPNPLSWPGPFAVGASTRPGDEVRWLAAWRALGEPVQLLVAPRHPRRLAEVGALLDAEGVRWVRRSALANGQVPADVEVVLLDTLGELGACLRGAAYAAIGGTFDPAIGGHAPWEAAHAGVPVVGGPEVWAQGDAFGDVNASLSVDLAAAIRQRRAPPSLDPPEPLGPRILTHCRSPAPEAAPRPWFGALAGLLGVGSRVRNAAYDRGWRRVVWVGVPVISVGSTNARSPGRTSTVAALIGALQVRGHRVGVAVRGYRRTERRTALRVSWENAGADALGDEGALHAQRGAWVAAGPDRIAGARALVDAGCTVVVLDDGLQHRALGRDLELVLVDARYPTARGGLPAGERREREAVPARTHLVLVTHASDGFSADGLRLHRQPGPWVRGDGSPAPIGPPAVALAGIGRAADFFAGLEITVEDRWALPDHQRLDGPWAERIRRWAAGRLVVCTAKDAVRLPQALRLIAAWRDVEVQLPDALLARLDGLGPVPRYSGP